MDLDQRSEHRLKDAQAPEEHGGVVAVERALDILEAFSPSKPEYGLTELAQSLALPKATTHRLLMTLVRRRYISTADGRYRLGTRVLDVAHSLISSLELRRIAHEHLLALRDQTGETAHLAILDATQIVYLDKVDSWHNVRPHTWVGYRADLHSTALGKALLAFEREEAIRRVLGERVLSRQTARTLVDPELVLGELRRTRDRGYALDDEEDTPGMRCVAAPVRDHSGGVCAAVGIAGPITRLDGDRVREVIPSVVAAAHRISDHLGAPVPLGEQGER